MGTTGDREDPERTQKGGGGARREGAGRAWAPEQVQRPVNSGSDGRPALGACVTQGAARSCIAQREGAMPWQADGPSVVPAHGQVHECEHVELCHDGEAQEHAVQEKAPAPQLLVQLPLVKVNTEHLQHMECGQKALAGWRVLEDQKALEGSEGTGRSEGTEGQRAPGRQWDHLFQIVIY